MKRAIKWIVDVITVILFLILVMILYGKMMIMFSDHKYPNYFGYTVFEVASGSMEPTLYVNDVILVKVTKENLKKDDVIAYYNGEAIVTHRIIFIDGDKLTVKGDNNNTVDKPIDKDQVIGKMVKVYRKLGIWKKVLNEPKILIAIFVTLILFDFALSFDDKKKIDDKKEKTKKKEEEKKDEKVIEYKTITKDDLIDLTRKVDIEEINELLASDDVKLKKKEVVNLKEKIKDIEKTEVLDIDDVIDNLSEKEKEFLDYTIRLDLDEIRKNIDENVK